MWDVVADPRNLPTWEPHIVGVEGLPHGALREGSEYWTVVRFLGVRARAKSKVVELRKPEHAKVRLSGAVDATVETWIEPLDGDRSRLRHRVEYRFPGGAIGKVAARAVQMLGAGAMLRRGVEAQKRQAERG